MRKLFAFLLTLTAIVFGVCSPASAQVGQIPFFPPIQPPSGGGGGYTGPGDAVSGASAFWSCARGYNAAYASPGTNPACDIVDTTTGLATCTIPIGISGFANLTAVVCPTGAPAVSVTTFCTVTHAGGCSVTKAYDQSGNSLPASQATLANMPTLALTGAPNSLPAMVFNGTSQVLVTAGTLSISSQPYTFSRVSERTGNTTNYNATLGTTGGVGNVEAGYSNTANTVYMFNNSSIPTASATDNAFHAIQSNFNNSGGTSNFYIDGTSTPGSLG